MICSQNREMLKGWLSISVILSYGISVIKRWVPMQVSKFGQGGGGGERAAFEHFCCPLSGEFDRKFALYCGHLNLTVQRAGPI